MYDDLVKRLRVACMNCKFWDSIHCCINGPCDGSISIEAADALAELMAKVDLREKVIEDYRTANMMLIDKFPKWIPCSERLPEEEKTVLTWGKEHQCILLDWMHDNKWCCFGDADYWMPLPEPPKEET